MHLKKLFLLAPGLAALGLCLAAPSESTVVRAGEDVFVAEDESLTEDMALFGSTISVDGYVDSDVIAFSRSIRIPGIVNQDLLGCAETIEIIGQVGDDLRVGARSVEVRGPVGDDAIAFCQGFTLAETGRIGGEARVWCAEAVFFGDVDGNLRASCQRAEIHGHVGGNLSVAAETIELAGSVDGEADLKARKIVLLPECVVNGHLKYTSINEIEIQPGAQILGSVEWQKAEVEALEKRAQKKEFLATFGTIWIFLKVAFFFGQLIVGLIFIGIFRRRASAIAQTLSGHLWKSLGIGFVFACCAIIAACILPFTIIGWPLEVLLICFSLAIWYLGPIVVGLTFGGLMVGAFKDARTGRMIGGLMLGLFILRALSFIPLLGWLIQVLVILFGTGAILISLRSTQNKSQEKQAV